MDLKIAETGNKESKTVPAISSNARTKIKIRSHRVISDYEKVNRGLVVCVLTLLAFFLTLEENNGDGAAKTSCTARSQSTHKCYEFQFSPDIVN